MLHLKSPQDRLVYKPKTGDNKQVHKAFYIKSNETNAFHGAIIWNHKSLQFLDFMGNYTV